MTTLTIPVDEEALRRVRERAQMQGTSVDAVLREFLGSYASIRSRREAALQDLLALPRAATARRGNGRWTRDELHERTA